MSLPVTAADTPERVTEALQLMPDRDLILVDTAGRAPRDENAIARLAEVLEAASPDETHLVLSSDRSERGALEVMECFRPLRFNRIVLSKLDEAATHGMILSVAAKAAAALSYVTTGQEYMETVAPGDGLVLAQLVMGLGSAELISGAGGAGRGGVLDS